MTRHSSQGRWSLGPPRRFTRNLLLPATVTGRPLLLKYTRNHAEARAEIAGHHLLAGHYRVPELHARLRVPGGRLLLYERLPIGPGHGLLLDLLNTEQPSRELRTYLDDLTAHYRAVIRRTAHRADPRTIVRKLYWDRAAPGGRLDQYYATAAPVLTDGTTDLPLSHLRDYTLHINEHHVRLDWDATLASLTQHFGSGEPVWAALTQGDPTDLNLAHPLAWLDFDTAGANSILGEFANFLWYTTALGGWIVPTYNPAAFADHPATFAHIVANTPELRHTSIDTADRALRISYRPRLSAPRRLAATVYWHQLVQPIATHLWPGVPLGKLLRPYVAMRILAVHDVTLLAPRDRMLLFARLAEVMDPGFDPASFFLTSEAPCPAP
ncbi:hypothetical protein [Streptomyces sp. YIM 98790]|uniref:hypothetical protein n=1 Tax=Streptomyces sp. YIM 98790 TaxID=2689077 RepID=UPI00140D1738|nr:hypothetical protein [Streptomyces sp. YIM 98790]